MYFTVILNPETRLKDIAQITQIACLSVASALKEEGVKKIGIKWPNDVLAGGKKISGILTESRFWGRKVKYLLLGVGVNLNNRIPAGLAGKAVSLKELKGSAVDRKDFLKCVLDTFFGYYKRWQKIGFKSFMPALKTLQVFMNKEVRVKQGDRVVKGRAVGLGEDGGLLLQKGKIKMAVCSGEVVS